MDPTVTLRQIRELYSKRYPTEDDMITLAVLIQSLDEWLTKGGHLPDTWAEPARDRVRKAAERTST